MDCQRLQALTEGFGEVGEIRSAFFSPLFVCIYLLSLHENFGQKQKQGYAEKSWVGNSGLLDNGGWLQSAKSEHKEEDSLSYFTLPCCVFLSIY